MTSEVAILNRHGIAIAADSAVTVGEERVWKTTNKIFSLGPQNDIGVMVYGAGAFCGFPWEIVVKAFKSQNTESFSLTSTCAERFQEFLNDERWKNPIHERLTAITIIVNEIVDLDDQSDKDNATAFRRSAKHLLETWIEVAQSKDILLDDIEYDAFIEEFGEDIEKTRTEHIPFHFPRYLDSLLKNYLFEYLRRSECKTDYESGVVICGYGDEEYYPTLYELIVDGRYSGRARCWMGRIANLNEDPMQSAQIIPFAQRDMTNLFMEGISGAYRGYFQTMIRQILEKKTKDIVDNYPGDEDEKAVERALQERTDREIAQRVTKDVLDFRLNEFVQPLMSNVQGLPREEMAAMAESLVELTSLRRKVDSVIQTVAGPVDVAFISKPDGFIWMKRKHYFDRNLNSDFFTRKRALTEAT